MKRKTNSVQRLVFKMVTENTGVHFLDSGFSNGRMWQRNQKKTIQDFMNEDEEKYVFNDKYGELERTVSVFHYLSGLDLDDVCTKFNLRNNKEDNWDGNVGELEECYGVSARAGHWLMDNHEVDVKYTFNTYNGDSDLSQIIQGSQLEINGDSYFLIQVHGGADARGGYTDAKLFKQNYWSCGIHEYLQEYKDRSETKEDLEERYIDDVEDAYDKTIKHKATYILERLDCDNELDAVKNMVSKLDSIAMLDDINHTIKTLGLELDEDLIKQINEFSFDVDQLKLEM
jgi:hypothetical protein